MSSELRMAGHPKRSMFYAYILQSENHPKELYRGHTADLRERVAEHNHGKCTHTAKYAPWKIKFYAAFETLELAQNFEQYLKTGSGHAFSKRHLGV
jgi:putative endonuclease